MKNEQAPKPPKVSKVTEFISYWKETTVAPFIAIGLLVGSIYGFRYLTNTRTTEDMNTIVVTMMSALVVVIIGMFVGYWKPLMHGEVDYETAPLGKCILDSFNTWFYFVALLLAFFWR